MKRVWHRHIDAILTDDDKARLDSAPFAGDLFDAGAEADRLAYKLDDVEGFEFTEAFCIKCEHCVLDKRVPHHPLFKCEIGGVMDVWSTRTAECPLADQRLVYIMRERDKHGNLLVLPLGLG